MSKINAPIKITSNVFYQELLPRMVTKMNKMEKGEELVLDLSATESIDAMAIPLLLNTARWITKERGTVPMIYIPNYEEKNQLKKYLEKIGFFNICDFYDYYEVNTERKKVEMDRCNFATYVFTKNAKNNSQEERERIEEYVYRTLAKNNSYIMFWKYWSDLNSTNNSGKIVNVAENAVRATCSNTGIHTKENGILTLQRNLHLRRVCISMADCGQGLYDTLMKKKDFTPVSISLDEFKKLKGETADLYAIAEALAYRFGENYGLHNMLMKFIDLNEENIKRQKEEKWSNYKIRIHTNFIRMVFSGKNCKELKSANAKKEFAEKVIKFGKDKYVTKKTSYYPGVHIEIEIPYEKESI